MSEMIAQRTRDLVANQATPTALSLDELTAGVRAFATLVNRASSQVAEWQRDLHDAEFEEAHPELRPRLANCEQRQKALADRLATIGRELRQLRTNVEDLRVDQEELSRCVCAGGTPKPGVNGVELPLHPTIAVATNPAAASLEQIAAALGMTVESLIQRVDSERASRVSSSTVSP